MQTHLVSMVAVGALASPLEVGADRASACAARAASMFRRAGCRVVRLGVIDDAAKAAAAGRAANIAGVSAVVLVPTSWYEDYLVLDMIEECRVPLLLWPQPGMETGALCGAQQTTAFLKNLLHPYQSVFGHLDDARCLASAMIFLRAAALHHRMRRVRIGMAGNRVNGMTHTAPNEFMLKRAIGPRLFFLDLPDLLADAAQQDAAGARRVWRQFKNLAGSCRIPETAGMESARIYLALRRLVAWHGLQALTIGCYPHLMGKVCLAASRLADEGVPMACEGDPHGAIGQLILQLLTGQPTHNTDWLDPLDDGTIVLTHCGSGSFKLAAATSDIVIDSVRLMGQGACALFPAKPGAVTMLNLTASANGYTCAMIEGEALPTTMLFPGNPVRVRLARRAQDYLEWIHNEGIGHHWMIGYGHVGAEIRAWISLCGPLVKLAEP